MPAVRRAFALVLLPPSPLTSLCRFCMTWKDLREVHEAEAFADLQCEVWWLMARGALLKKQDAACAVPWAWVWPSCPIAWEYAKAEFDSPVLKYTFLSEGKSCVSLSASKIYTVGGQGLGLYLCRILSYLSCSGQQQQREHQRINASIGGRGGWYDAALVRDLGKGIHHSRR